MKPPPTLSTLAAVLALGALHAFISSCATAPGPYAGITAQDREFAQTRFEVRCSTCHGMEGKGDGPLAFGLNPPPRDWTDMEWQAEVSDEFLEVVIAQGGQAGGLSALMPASDYADRKGVMQALVEIVRSYGR